MSSLVVFDLKFNELVSCLEFLIEKAWFFMHVCWRTVLYYADLSSSSL